MSLIIGSWGKFSIKTLCRSRRDCAAYRLVRRKIFVISAAVCITFFKVKFAIKYISWFLPFFTDNMLTWIRILYTICVNMCELIIMVYGIFPVKLSHTSAFILEGVRVLVVFKIHFLTILDLLEKGNLSLCHKLQYLVDA